MCEIEAGGETAASPRAATGSARLADIAAGDRSAFAGWLRTAEPAVRLSLRSFAERVDVEAVLQESLLRAWQCAPRVEPDGAENVLLRFTLRVARNLAIDEARRFRTAPASEELEPIHTPAVPDPWLRAHIERCRDELPAQPRRALDARIEADGEPDAELAQRLRMRKNTFFQNLARARRLLAACLERAEAR